MTSPSLEEKLDKIRSPNLQSQKQVSWRCIFIDFYVLKASCLVGAVDTHETMLAH